MKINEILNENLDRYILYLNNKPSASYSTQHEAEFHADIISKKTPKTKVEIKKEVCKLYNISESSSQCPECGGEIVSENQINEKKDACYYKVKSRYKVWPSAYASGALVKCRKKGAKNWGKSKK